MKPIKDKMRSKGVSRFGYNALDDVRTLIEYCNMLADKVNELNNEVQELRKQEKRNE